ncbi:MAG: GNAT family N-acetyltransferase [Rhodospirillaceae bacterium]|nr:GNAT family N-acetyltransferase [Rhodospirillaceae bacterium]
MSDAQMMLRPANKNDAHALAELINYAGDGLPLHLWERMVEPGEGPWDVGRRRAQRDEGSFSYRNATVATIGDKVVACMIGSPLGDKAIPIDLEDTPAMFVPLMELENKAAGTWYLNVLATYPEHRGNGIGVRFLAEALRSADRTGRNGVSIVVSDANHAARRLYEREGYREACARPMVKDDWDNPGKNWVLLLPAA